MADYISYEGYCIHCSTRRLADRKAWAATVHIEPETGGSRQSFEADRTFEDEDEAILYCFRYGKRIIDGEVADARLAAEA